MPTIRDEAGFVAYFVLSAGQGEIGSVSIFGDQQSAEESNRKSEEWVSENLSGPHTSAELRRWGSRARLWPFLTKRVWSALDTESACVFLAQFAALP